MAQWPNDEMAQWPNDEMARCLTLGPMPLTRQMVRSFGIVALFLATALFGIGSGVLFAFIGDLPQISALDDYQPSTITRVLGRDGSVVGEFATEHRDVVTYDQISPLLREAILSAEDKDFFNHAGLNVPRILVSFVKDVVRMRPEFGASTLTQQLARALFLTDDKTPERKIKEALLTVQIEKRYTKQQIFTMYCNQMYWGHGAYGVEAASRLYFGKSAKDLTLNEAATIAGIVNGNDRQSPYRNMAAAIARRNFTLSRMAANGYITQAQANAVRKQPIVTAGRGSRQSLAPYFVEQVRIQLQDKYGAKAIYEDGLTIKTGLDPSLQRAANTALDKGLRAIDKRRGYRKPTVNVLKTTPSIEAYRDAQWPRDPNADDVLPVVVTAADGATIAVRMGRWHGTIARGGYSWTGRRTADALVRRGDLIQARITTVDPNALAFTASLEQEPQLQGAVLAIDNHTGQILAEVGGLDFGRSQFNRAIQASRQVGSLFKPFVYTTAIDRGYTELTPLIDEPVSYPMGPGQPNYAPQNYDRTFEGTVTLRHALEDSRNVPTVRLMYTLEPANVIAYAHRLGVTSEIPPYLSSAIGAGEATLLEMTSAYTAFANQGVRMTPLPILEVTDRDGNVLEQHWSEPHEAIRADTAYVITNLLQGVVARGTGHTAATENLDWPLGGKTGTTDDFTDAWFIGFDPDITVGVWVGFDRKKSIGQGMAGAVAALPIWADVMKSWIDRRREQLPDTPTFDRPGNVVMVNGNAYIAGTQPAAAP